MLSLYNINAHGEGEIGNSNGRKSVFVRKIGNRNERKSGFAVRHALPPPYSTQTLVALPGIAGRSGMPPIWSEVECPRFTMGI